MTAEERPANDEQRPSRLQRLDRIFPRSPVYFVTACTEKRRHLLATPVMHASFIQFAKAGEERGAWVGRYVLMPDHLHLFVAFDDELIALSKWMKSLKNALSKALRLQGTPAPHWQKGFFDHVLRSSESSSEKWDYVRQNPVRAGLVLHADDWACQGEIYPLEFRRS